MKKTTQLFFVAVTFLFSVAAFSQSTVTGTVVDSDLNSPLPGANVIEKGTTNGTSTDFDGNFTLVTQASSGVIQISYVGYGTITLTFNGDTNFGSVSLASSNTLEEVVIVGTGVIDLATERKTPVAVSTVKAKDIQDKVGNTEFPEILNSTPSVYATKDSGGYGDSRINVRGFDQRNTAIIINGQPVNDMENGWVYWSNWQGLSDIAAGIQVQRGLGASKLAVPSIGGTITIVTKTTDRQEGGFAALTTGNDAYFKQVAGYSTGVGEKGFAASVLLGHWTGDGWVDGTAGEGYTYLMSFGYKASDKHAFNFTFTGAGQWHHQRSTWLSIRDYENFGGSPGSPNRKLNADWGTKDGDEYNIRRNFYNKPIGTFNWDWNINDNVSLSTSIYGSWGRGGGTGARGNNFRNSDIDLFPFRRDLTEHLLENGSGAASRFSDGSINFDNVIAVNQATTNPYSGANSNYTGQLIGSNGYNADDVNRAVLIRRASMNSHNWYGAIANLKYEVGDWTFGGGLDLRTYKGYHYRVLNDLLGLDGYYSTGNRNLVNGVILTETISASPFKNTGISGDKIDYYNLGIVKWIGFNGIVEYTKDKLSAVLQGGISNQSYKRVDYFDQPGNVESDTEKIGGGYVKGGANYNINDQHNVFFNTGFISRQPIFDAVFPNFANDIREDLQNEKIFSVELGYGFRGDNIGVNLNLYSTSWKDRFISRGVTIAGGADGTANYDGVEQLHQGIEIDGFYRPINNLTINGMLSIGNWKYKDNVEASVFDDNQQLIGTSTLYIKDVKVGDAAQTTASIGADYQILDGLNVQLTWRHAANLYADFDIASDDNFLDSDNLGALELPSYNLFDLGVGYRLNLGSTQSLYFRGNVNNLFDEEYIAESNSNIHGTANGSYKGIDKTNYVWFGFGTTWNLSVRYNF